MALKIRPLILVSGQNLNIPCISRTANSRLGRRAPQLRVKSHLPVSENLLAPARLGAPGDELDLEVLWAALLL